MVAKVVNFGHQTPLNNIGVNATEGDRSKSRSGLYFSIGLLRGTFPIKHFEKIQSLAITLLGGGQYERRNRLRNYLNGYMHPSGSVMGTDHVGQYGVIDSSHGYIELKGGVCSQIKPARLRKFMRVLEEKYSFKPTGCDLTIDDYDKEVTVAYVHKLINKWHYVGFRNTPRNHGDGRNNDRGYTVTLGRKGSSGGGKFFRVYDKSLESNGVIDSIRYELHLCDHYAIECVKHLCSVPFSCWGDVVRGWISGAVDFVKRRGEKDKNPGRRKRYDWWQRIVGHDIQLKPKKEENEPSLDRIKTWFHKQVAPSLAVLMWTMSDEDFWFFFWNLVFEGESRFREKHYWMIHCFGMNSSGMNRSNSS